MAMGSQRGCKDGKMVQAVCSIPDIAWGSLIGAGIAYRSCLVLIVHNLPDARLYEELGALIAWEHSHIHLLQSNTDFQHYHSTKVLSIGLTTMAARLSRQHCTTGIDEDELVGLHTGGMR